MDDKTWYESKIKGAPQNHVWKILEASGYLSKWVSRSLHGYLERKHDELTLGAYGNANQDHIWIVNNGVTASASKVPGQAPKVILHSLAKTPGSEGDVKETILSLLSEIKHKGWIYLPPTFSVHFSAGSKESIPFSKFMGTLDPEHYWAEQVFVGRRILKEEESATPLFVGVKHLHQNYWEPGFRKMYATVGDIPVASGVFEIGDEGFCPFGLLNTLRIRTIDPKGDCTAVKEALILEAEKAYLDRGVKSFLVITDNDFGHTHLLEKVGAGTVWSFGIEVFRQWQHYLEQS